MWSWNNEYTHLHPPPREHNLLKCVFCLCCCFFFSGGGGVEESQIVWQQIPSSTSEVIC
jgi:hypothetical protein